MWKPISERPSKPIQAEVFFADMTLTNPEGEEVSAVIAPFRDERRQIAFYDGDTWRYMGTGHDMYEFQDTPSEYLPTHWRELPPLP